MAELVEIEQNGHARIIRLNRPEKKNALSEALAWSVVNAVAEAAVDDDVWAIGITGSGDSFCAGLDLSGERESASPHGPISDAAVRAVDLRGQVRLELANIRRCFETEDAKEARRAFFEKRAPRFAGR